MGSDIISFHCLHHYLRRGGGGGGGGGLMKKEKKTIKKKTGGGRSISKAVQHQLDTERSGDKIQVNYIVLRPNGLPQGI